MNLKELLKPSILKIVIFSILSIVFLYIIKESVCGVVLFYGFCYKAYGFPFFYFVTGNVDTAAGHIKTFFLGNFFTKYGNFSFNPLAFVLNIVIFYLVACLIASLLKIMKILK